MLAREIGVSLCHVRNLMNGAKPRPPTLRKLRAWCARRARMELPEPPPAPGAWSARMFSRGRLDPDCLAALERWAVFQVWHDQVLCADMQPPGLPGIARELGVDWGSFRQFLVGARPSESQFSRVLSFKPVAAPKWHISNAYLHNMS